MQEPAETTRTEADEAVAQRVAEFSAAIEAQNLDRVRELAAGLRAPDLADVLELLGADERVTLIQALGADFDPEVLSELDAGVRDQLFETLPKDFLAQAVSQLETDDAAYVLEGLEEAEKQDLLARMPAQDRLALERNLEYPEETAGRLMQTDFVAVPPFWTVGQVIDHMRETDDLPETFSDIFVVDPAHRVLGSVDLSRLLRTKRQVPVETIMDRDRHVISATADQEEIAREFERYDLKSAPVADEHGRLVGAITVDDVVEVIQEETEEDLRRLAGVGDESLADSVVNTVRNRIQWLALNLVTAMLSASVIKLFDASIEQMVALAVLMPIVASMGGNAATQTMAVAVRALATRELGRVNARRIILREASVGLINGFVLAALLALVVYVVFGRGTLGIVIAAAMIFNLFAAALAGILIPLGLERLGFDPAVASGVFVTTVTDIVGFFAFLGLATLFLL
ncbi:MAG TPA: magnesium transporter [Hyphomicrobiaceae bacterium]|jgi:magnesium transporter